MSKPNAYLEKQKALRQAYFDIGCDKATQQFFDYLCLVLHDPEVMGAVTFGSNGIKKIHDALQELDKKYNEAWSGKMESDYLQDQLDKNLKEIFGEIVPFRERYPYLKEWDYNKPCKK